jgi:CubicO group peptidase (beta-lactamase class C family)
MSNAFTRREALQRSAGAFFLPLDSLWRSRGPHGALQRVTGAADADRDLVAGLSTLIPDAMKRKGVPGLSIGLIREGRVIWSRGFGVANVDRRAPVTSDTVFEAASLSKPVFALAVLTLCDSGTLDLDRPLKDYLPAAVPVDDPRAKLITAAMVLSHTSGLPHGRPARTPIALRFAPGARFAYSATGFQCLQAVVEHLTRQPLAAFMKKTVLEPLAMDDSSFGWVDKYKASAADGYDEDGDVGLSGNGEYLEATPEELTRLKADFPEYRYPSAAAGLYTTASDYCKFVMELLQPERVRLSGRLMERLFHPRVQVTDGISWGLGWGLETTSAGEAFWHWGDWGVFRHFTMAGRRHKSGVVILTNSFNGPQVYREVVPKVLEGPHPSLAWVDRYRP